MNNTALNYFIFEWSLVNPDESAVFDSKLAV